MHSRQGVRTAVVLAAAITVAFLGGVGTAAAQSAEPVSVRTGTVPFDLLGPVGVGAIVLGIVGLVAGTIRSRRRTREVASSTPSRPEQADPPTEPLLLPVARAFRGLDKH